MFCCGQEEVGWRNRDILAAAAEVAMGIDKFSWKPITAEIAGALGMIHSNGEILVHFKVKMRGIHPVVVSNGANLLPPGDLLSFTDKNFVEVC